MVFSWPMCRDNPVCKPKKNPPFDKGESIAIN